jgi:hypothetical protein
VRVWDVQSNISRWVGGGRGRRERVCVRIMCIMGLTGWMFVGGEVCFVSPEIKPPPPHRLKHRG